MIALMNVDNLPVAIEPDFIESVEASPDSRELCVVRMSSGKEHHIRRSYTYVTGIIRKHYEEGTYYDAHGTVSGSL
jgi:uncharacterized protein YlzI (FlbEa/FlbD family)